MDLTTLSPTPGSRHRKKIVGHGVGSGHGRHATRGMKGQKSRRGDSVMTGFEGGQTPILRRIPKRGFTPPFPKRYQVLNVQDLETLFKPNSQVTPEYLASEGIVKRNLPLKVLGWGELKKSLQVSAHSFSASAKAKIEKAGGTATLLK
ncbi:MAG: 50S ribosomal protein L15 [Elusimicrobia bacterium RIFCSPLOWO2_01_FULL_54_10]|nr:MAG: 50S ribosomal protein L15 [Elusimicrobia bacterium RIFCSPLOWO2_01_FULL_54_10]